MCCIEKSILILNKSVHFQSNSFFAWKSDTNCCLIFTIIIQDAYRIRCGFHTLLS